MAYYYYATAQKSTGVQLCERGNFTSPNHLNLLLAKNNRIEVFLVCPEGLKLLKEIGIYGKIQVMKLFKSSKVNKDMLFVLTAKFDAMILECELEDDKFNIYTKAHGNISDRIGELSELGPIAIIDPDAKVIALKIYNGLLKIIPLEEGHELKAVNIRTEEADIQDINFLHGYANPTIILLHSDSNGMHIKTHELSLKEKEFTKALWKQDNIEMEASIIIPIPAALGGAIIVGQESILYHDGTSFVAVAPPIIKNSSIICFAQVDTGGVRHVLCDMAGNLFMLLLEVEEKIDGTMCVKDIKIEFLGEVSIPECITYLDNGVFFIGSRLGDSQLIKLDKNLNPETNSYITVMDTFLNLAPIIDMVVVDLGGQGRKQLITCSGSGKEGSLKIISNGITIHEQATIELNGIKGIWALQSNPDSPLHSVIILSFVGQTKILSLNGEELEETEIPGFITDQQTLYCGNVNNSTLLQIIPTSVRLISLQQKQDVLYEWRPPVGKSISVVAANNFQIACALGNELYYFEVSNKQILEKKFRVMEHEISCLDISPLDRCSQAKFIILGLWNDISARILLVPSLDEVHKEFLGGEIIPRSILYIYLESKHYILVGLGNGSLLYYQLDPNDGNLTERKRVTLGTQPVVFQKFNFLGTTTVFACSDLPTVVYSSNQRLVFSNVNIKRINCMCSLNSDGFPESLALVTDNIIIIGTMNEIQKLHVRSVPLHEAPKRIAYQRSTQTFGVTSCRVDALEPLGFTTTVKPDCASLRAQNTSTANSTACTASNPISDSAMEIEVHHFLLLDQQTFEVLHAYQMLPTEQCLSLISAKLGSETEDYYIVGTAFMNCEDSEPKSGRIILFQVEDGKLVQVAEKAIKGACYALCDLNGKLLASIGCTVWLFEWTNGKELSIECNHDNNIIALYLRTHGDFVLIGDLMRSLALIQYKSVSGNFEEICRDYNPNWMTAIEIIDDDTYLGAENTFNIFACQRNNSSTNDEERERIQEVGLFYLGDLVNVFRKGTLVLEQLNENSELAQSSFLLGSVSGAIGVITQIKKEEYNLFLELQNKLAYLIKPVGKIEHSHWRSFSNSLTTEPSKGFIDGDLIECFLDLTRAEMSEAIKGISVHNNATGQSEYVTVDDIIKIVENFSRLH